MARTCFYKGRGLRPAIIEKDYYVTEPLRELALTASDHFAYKQRVAATGDVRNRVLLEAGIASGRDPSDSNGKGQGSVRVGPLGSVARPSLMSSPREPAAWPVTKLS